MEDLTDPALWLPEPAVAMLDSWYRDPPRLMQADRVARRRIGIYEERDLVHGGILDWITSVTRATNPRPIPDDLEQLHRRLLACIKNASLKAIRGTEDRRDTEGWQRPVYSFWGYAFVRLPRRFRGDRPLSLVFERLGERETAGADADDSSRPILSNLAAVSPWLIEERERAFEQRCEALDERRQKLSALYALVWDALRLELSDRQQIAIAFDFACRIPPKDIPTMLRIRKTTYKTHRRRALEKLRKAFLAKRPTDDDPDTAYWLAEIQAMGRRAARRDAWLKAYRRTAAFKAAESARKLYRHEKKLAVARSRRRLDRAKPA